MILILILILIIMFVIMYLRAETFQDFDKNQLENIEKSIKQIKNELNLSDKVIDLNSPLLDEYLNLLTAETADVNTKSGNELPFIENNNYTKYNHELKMLLNSKKIRQLFIINMLKNKINYLTGSFKNIKELKEDQKMENELNEC